MNMRETENVWMIDEWVSCYDFDVLRKCFPIGQRWFLGFNLIKMEVIHNIKKKSGIYHMLLYCPATNKGS